MEMPSDALILKAFFYLKFSFLKGRKEGEF
ncbi:hypothetical protein SAMN05428988_4467 [Chitinophaga sp. YR573]|nr:hypothetical protein SAMN05428988_4467 [Chitinophaga sp. YR573]